MKIAIQTLGCKVNQSESASMEGVLRENNYEIVGPSGSPDICIINTCTVTGKSDQESRRLIRKAVRSGAKVIATGCYAQLRHEELSHIKGLHLVIGNAGKGEILKYLGKTASENGTAVSVEPSDKPLTSQPYFSSRSRAFLKIQDGCNFSCSYCTVPDARGKSRSLSKEEVMSGMSKLAADGYREVVLTGIHIGSYGTDLNPAISLIKLVKEITLAFPNVRIRLSSLEPREFDFGYLQLMKSGNVCRHLHIPLQSGSDKVLKAMNRGYSTSFYKQLINRIITSYPDISIGTDIVVGFPGESDNDFDDTVKFVESLPLSYLHVFPYSKRPGTKAALLEDQITDKVKKSRARRLIDISNLKKYNYNIGNLGRELNVIVENKLGTDSIYSSISSNYLRILIASRSLEQGQIIKVRVKSVTDEGLIAVPA
jgi:threonylcarbamoyladenosine tRNA methylthiotransferase MtaB